MSDNIVVHFGAPKAASTLLQDYFSKHPEIAWMPHVVEGWGRWTTCFFENNLKVCVFGDEAFSVNEERAKLVSENISRIIPNAKILYVIRSVNESTLWSHYQQQVKSGYRGTLRDFWKAPNNDRHEYFAYSRIIDVFEEYFPLDNILVMPFEMLVDDTYKFVDILNNFLGINKCDYSFEKRVNTSMDESQIAFLRLVQPVIWKIAKYYGTRKMPHTTKFLRLVDTSLFRKTSKFFGRFCSKETFVKDDYRYVAENVRFKSEKFRYLPTFQDYLDFYCDNTELD